MVTCSFHLDFPFLLFSDLENEEEQGNTVGYRAVPFSYGSPSESATKKNTEDESGFQPPFSVPDHLLQNLPPTEKVHQIIARTATFVSKHGGQSEIILRVKQGDNPTFGFLMPDHDLHPYFRFLVDHQELLNSAVDGKEEGNKGSQTGGLSGALTLLGSVYGSGEDDEGATEDDQALAENDSKAAGDGANLDISHGPEQTDFTVKIVRQDGAAHRHLDVSLKEGAHVIKKNHLITKVKPGSMSGSKKEGDSSGSISSIVDKLPGLAMPVPSDVETSILEPPSDLKRVVDKIVEFILRNGKEFEAVLVQQDVKHGRFPFLLPSNQYYPYYQRVLLKAQESRSVGRGFNSEKRDSLVRGVEKKTASKELSALPLASDISYDAERKEKFKMVIGKSKKDGQDQPSKATQPQVGVSMDATAAAAILQAATRGIKNPNVEFLSKASVNGISKGLSGEGGEAASVSSQRPDQSTEPGVSVPVAKAMAKTAAIVAADEADSSEASLTKEQKLKAERLKRAKMFAAMIKSGSAPLKTEPLDRLSVDLPKSGFSGPGAEMICLAAREREGSSVLPDKNTADKIEKSEGKEPADSYNERRSKRRYRSRSNRDEEKDGGEEEEGEQGGEEDMDHKHSRKKRRNRDRHKHRRRHSSSKDNYSRHKHKDDSMSDDERSSYQHEQYSSADDEHGQSKRGHKSDDSDHEHRHSRRRRKSHRSSNVEDKHSQHRRKHDDSDYEDQHSQHQDRYGSSDDYEHHHSKHRHKHGCSSDNEHRHQVKSVKQRRISRFEREEDLEEGEILAKSDQSKVSEGGGGASREASVDLWKSYQDARPPSQPCETTEVSDDFRAKIRAMLMQTL
uniref:Uncharacterized protein MANES_03G133700 n=2 Tax=Rhizophora mucronata TaxID=61149 RepID=A0A2P2JW84_RHIMU